MVRHHVAQRPGGVVIAAAAAHAERLRDRYLDMLDMVPVPDRLEQSVGEAKNQNVLYRLLAQIMVDAKNLVFAKDTEKLAVERLRRGEIGAERLLDDDTPPGSIILPRQARLAEMASDDSEACGGVAR